MSEQVADHRWNAVNLRIWNGEANHAKICGDLYDLPKIGRVDCHERGLRLLSQNAGNGIVLNHGLRAQFRDEANCAGIPRAYFPLEIPTEQLLVQHDHAALRTGK